MGNWGLPHQTGGTTTSTGEDVPLANLRAYQMGAADATRMASVGMVPVATVHRTPHGVELLEKKMPEATYGK